MSERILKVGFFVRFKPCYSYERNTSQTKPNQTKMPRMQGQLVSFLGDVPTIG